MLTDRQMQFKEAMKKLLVGRAAIAFATLEVKATGVAGLLFEDLTATEVQEVVSALTEEHTVTLTPGGTVVDPTTFVRWIEERRQVTPTPWWDRYEQMLVGRDWAAPVISALADQTDEVVELLGDPLQGGQWRRRGLLMGEVQSGKTATYIGVLNKAIDYGYRVIIVIGGHTNELRRQTQARVDTDLLGIDSEYFDDNIAHAKLPQVGVGLIDPDMRANLMTTVRGDFGSAKRSGGMTSIESDTPTVFVIKKNARLIANVANYIRQQAKDGVLDIPLVVIDDEADWGTPNTGSETDPTRVNKEIRRLLESSRRSSYLGITATPFANIFIDDEALDSDGGQDLFPRDYIRVMPAPSNYRGIQKYFQPQDMAVRTDVDDCMDLIPIVHKSSLVVDELPLSLQRAVVAFMVGTAIRRLRDREARAASMMVNVSRFNDVQGQVSDLLQDYLEHCIAMIRSEFARDSIVVSETAELFEAVWAEDLDVDSDVTWDDIRSTLIDVSPEFRVDLVNSRTASERAKKRKLLSKHQRIEEDKRPTIYVGGDVLSRGLTLEGLQVSYFVREPRTMDTLMQMGRWFGYRPGYGDLVQVWIPDSTAEDFQWSAEVTEELRDMLLEMRARELTPRDFGLRVRTHPEGFNIVAANKSKNTSVVHEGPILWENKLAEASKLSANSAIQATNRDALADLIERLEHLAKSGVVVSELSIGGYKSWRNVPIDDIYEFFRLFRGHPQDPFWGSQNLELSPQIVDALAYAKGSEVWDVALVSGKGADARVTEALRVPGSLRENMGGKGDLIKVSNRRVATPQSLAGSMSVKQKLDAGRLSQSEALEKLEHPVLLLFVLTTENPNGPTGFDTVYVDPDAPLVTAAVAFPKLDEMTAVRLAARASRYRVNTVWLRNLYGYTDDGDDILDEESL